MYVEKYFIATFMQQNKRLCSTQTNLFFAH